MAVRLGRGLGALIPQIEEEEKLQSSSSRMLEDVRVHLIEPNPFQPREDFDPEQLAELAHSIKQNGVIQPVTVRRRDNGYELIAGERRLRAVKSLGYDTVPAFVVDVQSNQEMLALSLIENIQREDLNPIDEANAYKRLMEECQLTQEAAARRVGKERSTVANFLRLLKLPDAIQESIRAGEVTMGHARALIPVKDEKDQQDLWRRVVDEGLTVRQVEELSKQGNGAPRKAKKQRGASKPRSPYLVAFEDRLRSTLSTQVHVHEQGGKGRIEIEFYSPEELERLVDIIDKI